jgi:glycosyltransferase involved in cell wall biosynthesis
MNKGAIVTTNQTYLISIITVVFNGANFIEDTILSIINQTYKNIEYIIIDGGSTDGTVDIIKKYEDKITFWISEKDNGIYDAMNKGTLKAKGEWLNYMNAGDRFYKNTTIEEVSKELNEANDAAVIYGDTEMIFHEHDRYIRHAKKDGHKYHHRFVHQSSFIRRSIAVKYPYDINFKIAADADFFTKLYSNGYVLQKIDNVICSFDANGVSSSPKINTLIKEDIAIAKKYGKIIVIKLIFMFMIKKIIYVFFTDATVKKIKLFYNKLVNFVV